MHGTYTGPDKSDKGLKNGSCNRSSCQASPANWYNHGSYAWYCASCREDIEFDISNFYNWNTNWKPLLKHPMFETETMMNERLAKANVEV